MDFRSLVKLLTRRAIGDNVGVSALTNIPSVAELPPAEDNDGLLLQGYAATWNLDRVGDAFNPFSLDKAVKAYMATNPVLLFSHQYGLPPIGKVLNAEVHRNKGLWIEALLPKPAPGSFAAEVWDAAKNGVLRALSVGGKWLRHDKHTHSEIFDADLCEISLCPVALNGDAIATAVTPSPVKCLGATYLTTADYETALSNARDQLALCELRFDVAAMTLRARS